MEAREEIAVALAQVWEESESLLDQRVAAVEAAADSLEGGALPEREREEAEHAAHKLAGSLGMLGSPEGSSIASEAEVLLRRRPRRPGRLTELARMLRVEFDLARP